MIWRGSSFGGGIFLVVLLTFFLLVGGLLLTGRSDVIVDDQGISRCLFGKTWQTIQWKNIRLITAFPVSGGYGYTSRAYNIYPMIKPHYSLMPSGKMSFTDKIEDAPKLIELLNLYVLKYGIKIEIQDTLLGKLNPATHL